MIKQNSQTAVKWSNKRWSQCSTKPIFTASKNWLINFENFDYLFVCFISVNLIGEATSADHIAIEGFFFFQELKSHRAERLEYGECLKADETGL